MLKALLSFGLSFLVLLSGFSWHVEEHHCMGRVMDRAFLASAKSCGMEQSMQWQKAASADRVLLSNGFRCCEDVTFSVEKQEDIQDVNGDFQGLAIPRLEVVTTSLYRVEVLQSTPNPYRPPPLPYGRKRLNWLQVYRI